jgi:CubicO group peptidase (beta-lactamase class C family)
MRKVLVAFCLSAVAAVAAGDDNGYSLEEARSFRHAWTIDNWDNGGPLMRYVFLNMPEFWNHSIISRAGSVRVLPDNPRADVSGFVATTDRGKISLADYVNDSTVNGAIILHQGKIVFEAYPRMRPYDKHLYMSVSKALASTLIAILEDRELVDTSTPVKNYLPELTDSGWADVAVRDVLDMASGIGCLQQIDGAYDNPDLCYYQFEASLGWLRATDKTWDDTYKYIASMSPHRPPGEAFEYTSTNTFVLAWLAEQVAGRKYADLISSEIWQLIGAESDALLVAPRHGVQIASSGISSTLRDMARFGLLFTPSGRDVLHPVISESYLDKIQNGGRPAIFNAGREDKAREVDGEPARHNSYQWDFVMDDGDFFKGGYGGQGLYISPSRDLVIAFFGTFDEDGRGHEMTRIARQLAKSTLFN